MKIKKTKNINCSKIIFTTFSPWQNKKRSPSNGLIEPVLSYFLPRVNKFVLIDQPHPGSDRLIPEVETYHKGKIEKRSRSSFFVSWLYPFLLLTNKIGTNFIFKIRDFLSVLDFSINSREHFDLFIGLESINTLAGIFLKKLGLVNHVIYYVSDFSLKRYVNPWQNKLYLFLDRIAFKKSDFVWDISTAVMPARIEAGLDENIKKTSSYVPIGLFSEQITHSLADQQIPYSLVYAGIVSPENGSDIAVKALKKILPSFPKAQLHIYATGEDNEIQKLRDLTNKLVVQQKVFIHGFVPNQTELIKDLSQYKIGLAPYKAKRNSPRWWADATRIRLYLAAGLPTITTPVPPAGNDLVKNNSGLIVKDDPTQFAKAINELFRQHNRYNKIKQNALTQAKNTTWDKIYTKTLKDIGINLKK